MDREFFYDKETRSELAAFNPYLKKDIEDARIALGMPKGGFLTSEEANKWYIEHYRRAKGKPPEPKNPWNWHLPKELVDMLDSFSYSAKPSRVNFDSDVPLDRYAMDLIHKFGLLEQMVAGLRSYIMMEKHNYPGIPGPLQPTFVPIDEGWEGTKYMAIVAGLDESTTKEQWLDVWHSFQNRGLWGKNKAPNRRPSDSVLLRDLTLWSWVKKDGKTVKEALDNWLKKHPEDSNLLNGEDTVRKAIKKVDKLMKPVSS